MDREEIQSQLDAFERNPREAMNRLPAKRDAGGRIVGAAQTAFGGEAIDSKDYVLHRDKLRRKFHTSVGGVTYSLEAVIPGRAPYEGHDRAENLVDELRHRKPAEMDAADLRKAALAETPWSDDYWAIYLGVLGKRYADPDFPASASWKENFDYIRSRPLAGIAERGAQEAIDRLSPSEKYDLLVGDTRGTLTGAMWAEGKHYHERYGKVETWMGICHGWAPAAFMLPRPRKAVTVQAAGGRTAIRFYPSDIKALASLLWANGRTASKFIGGRSDDKDPELNEVGRPISSEVFDTNPGTWHLAVVNQIGVAKRSFVMDATYDYEVWNQPVHAYEYFYFNPQAMRWASTLGEATVARAAFTSDRFRDFRSADHASVAGVAMRVSYVVETDPSHKDTDDPGEDSVRTVDYYYDLELDGDGKILGGEWYLNRHPDFLWTPPPGARVVTPADAFASGAWGASGPPPASFCKAAQRGSANGLPLAKIVEHLLQLANG